MTDESYQTKGYESIFASVQEAEISHLLREAKLSVSGDTAKAGMAVSFQGEVTAGTPGTHRDVDQAVTYAAANNIAIVPAGILVRPKILPDNYQIDDAITDGTIILYLPLGHNIEVRVLMLDQSADVLPGQLLGLSATPGYLAPVTHTFSATPTVQELETALGSLLEKVGVVTAVAEDVAGTNIIVHALV